MIYHRFVFTSGQSTRTAIFRAVTGITDQTIIDAMYGVEYMLQDMELISPLGSPADAPNYVSALYPFVGGTSTTHSFNFMNVNAHRLSYSGSPTHNENGIQFNGVNQFADTNFRASDLAQNSSHMSYYIDAPVVDPARSGQGLMGMGITQRDNLFLAANRGNLGLYAVSNAVVLHEQPAPVVGLALGTITSDNSIAMFQAGIEQARTPAAQGLAEHPPATITIGKVNVVNAHSAIPCSFASVGRGLNTEQAANFSFAVQTFQQAIGRAR